VELVEMVKLLLLLVFRFFMLVVVAVVAMAVRVLVEPEAVETVDEIRDLTVKMELLTWAAVVVEQTEATLVLVDLEL
jgi:hypothetical protein